MHYNTTDYVLLYTVHCRNGLKYGHLLRYFAQVEYSYRYFAYLYSFYIQVEFSATLATLSSATNFNNSFTVYSEMNFRIG